MTTQTETTASPKDAALKLALEALDQLTNVADTFSVSGVYLNEEVWAKKCLSDAYFAITTIEEALVQEKALQALHDENERLGLYKDAYEQTERESVRLQCITCGTVYADGVPPQVAQPEQEPVALQMDVIVVNLVREGINKHRARELAEHFIKHTTPPQHFLMAEHWKAEYNKLKAKQWVGLTEEEVIDCWPGLVMHMNSAEFWKNIETKLKEKNT